MSVFMKVKTGVCLLALATIFPRVGLADAACFEQRIIALWVERYSLQQSVVKQTIESQDLEETLEQIYDRFLDKALELEDARTGFEVFEVQWNIESHENSIVDYDLVPKALRDCVKWMWTD